jgi:TonB-dependent siderophore receptor
MRSASSLALFLLFLSFVMAPSPAWPQQPSPAPTPPADEPPRREETVDVEAELPALPPSSSAATRLPVSVQDLPVTVSVVPRSLMRDQSDFVLGDALRNASGVTVGAGFGVFDFFTIRGFDSLTGGLVLTDGIPEPESTFHPLYNVRQVEVLKGPAAFLYGGNALAGAVQIVRKQPLTGRFADASFTYGYFQTFEGAVDGNAATSDGKLAARLNGVWQGTDSYRDVGDGSIAAVNPSFVWRPDDRTRVGLGFEYVKSKWPPDSGLPFVGESGSDLAPVPRETSYQSSFDFSEQDAYRLRFEAERKLGGNLTLRNRFYFTELGWDSRGTLLNGAFPFPDGNTYVLRTLVILDDTQRLLGDQLELNSSFQTGSVGHDLLVGVELVRLTDRFVQDIALLDPLNMLDPVEPNQNPTPVTIPAFGLAGDSRSLVLAPYVVDRLSLSRKWQAFVGARLDTLDYEDEPTGTSRDDTKLSPLLGLVFSPTSTLSLHASGGTAFAPPSTQVVGPREPETSRQLEAGAKLQFLGGKAFLGASGYDLRREDIAIPDSSGLFTQAGDQRSRGIEVDFSAEPAKGLVTYANYAFTDAELTRFTEMVVTPVGPVLLDHSGNTPAFVPRHLFNVWLSKQFGNGLGLAAGVRALSEQFVGEDNRYTIPGYATLDAAVSYTLGRVRLGVNFKNITGTDYATRGFGGVSAIPARPFECLARVDLRFGSRPN